MRVYVTLLLLTFAKSSIQLCRSTVGVTTCGNEILQRGNPLRVNNYKYLLEFEKGTLREIPTGTFKFLTELKILHISNNKVNNLEVGAFERLYNLEKLSLYNNQLEIIKNGVLRDCRNLKILDLGMNKISDIEQYVFEDTANLIELNIGFNNFQKVPSAIANLKSLKILNLNNNKLKSLPPNSFDKLNKLEVLNLSDNEIASLATGAFGGLNNLKELNLKSNYLSSLNTQNLLGDLGALVTIKLSVNSFGCQTLKNIVDAFEKRRVTVARGYSKSRDVVNGIGCSRP
nr:leucine-rich repeat-containing protein 15-like [Leptinotarsa decemlineata]